MLKDLIFSRDIGIDLGTATVLVYVEGKGIVMREPSVVAIDKTTDKVIKVGTPAQDLVGRTPDSIVTMRPLKDGIVNQYEVTERMLQYFIRRACGKSLLQPRIMISVPSSMSEVEERAILEAAAEAGARKTFLIRSPIAAAMGAGLNIKTAIGNMTVDIGGGVTEVAVISLGGIVVSRTLPVGGDSFDDAIVKYVRDNYGLLIGDRTAENIKIKILFLLEEDIMAQTDGYIYNNAKELQAKFPEYIELEFTDAMKNPTRFKKYLSSNTDTIDFNSVIIEFGESYQIRNFKTFCASAVLFTNDNIL